MAPERSWLALRTAIAILVVETTVVAVAAIRKRAPAGKVLLVSILPSGKKPDTELRESGE